MFLLTELVYLLWFIYCCNVFITKKQKKFLSGIYKKLNYLSGYQPDGSKNQGGYPPETGYPPQTGYPSQAGPQTGYPPQAGYPPQTGGYPPQYGAGYNQPSNYGQFKFSLCHDPCTISLFNNIVHLKLLFSELKLIISNLGYGSPEPEHLDPEPTFVGGSFSDKAVRRGFIRKVKGI